MILRLAALAGLIAFPTAGWSSGPVALTTLDGTRTIEGDLIAFDGEFLRVETEFSLLVAWVLLSSAGPDFIK